MNREQKAATIAELASEIRQSLAVFAVDYRGLSVPQAAELRSKLRDADASFRVVKNSLTERAADEVGADSLKPMLSGPTALTFVRGDAALAAKVLADYARLTQLLPFKGGLMEGDVLEVSQILAISRLPSREVLYGQLVGMVASPVSGLVRTLGALLGGLAVALGQVREKKESGEIPAARAPETAIESAPATEPPPPDAGPAEEARDQSEQPAAESVQDEEPAAEPVQDHKSASEPVQDEAPAAEPEQDHKSASEPARDNQADASAQEQADDAEATKED
jgi:large subunit ribosomal protein L10